MTKTEFEQLKTPVILREKGVARDRVYYARVVKTSMDRGPGIYFDLVIGKFGTSKQLNLHSKPIYLPLSSYFTKIPWKQAKREILDLLLGK